MTDIYYAICSKIFLVENLCGVCQQYSLCREKFCSLPTTAYFIVLIQSMKIFSGRTLRLIKSVKTANISLLNVLLYKVAMPGSAKRDNYHLSMMDHHDQ